MPKNPNRCDNCESRQNWLDNPKEFSPGPVGYIPNTEMLANAKKICPGLSVHLRKVTGADILIEGDRLSLPVGKVALQCNYFQVAFGDPMGR